MLAAAADHSSILPQSDLVYIAFRLCFVDVASEIEACEGFEEEEEAEGVNFGFLCNHIPLYRDVPPIVQLDLLASLWEKHCDRELREIYLAEAVVLYSICRDAGRIASELYEFDLSGLLGDGPRTVTHPIAERFCEELEELFECFWDDEDFLMVGADSDRVPFTETARHICPRHSP